MTFSYVPGESPHPGPWPDDQFERLGALLRSLHEASATFAPPGGIKWQSTWLHEIRSSDRLVIGHGDPAPWNIVGVNGAPEALVDWEFAGPIDPITELAYMVWLNAQLHDDDIAALQGLANAPTRARHATSILNGYGVPAAQRAEVVDRMIEVAIHSARAEAVLANVTPESTEAVDADGYPVLWAITWRARSASWMTRHRAALISSGR